MERTNGASINRRLLPLRAVAVVAALFTAAACTSEARPDNPDQAETLNSETLDQLHCAGPEGDLATEPLFQDVVRRFINSAETSKEEVTYGKLVNIQDGRGLTSQDPNGLTSGTLDLALAIRAYQAAPEADQDGVEQLTGYLPALDAIGERYIARGYDELHDAEGKLIKPGDTEGLDGLENAWVSAASDPVFTETMDQFFVESKITPALALARKMGVEFGSVACQAMLVDAYVIQGESGLEDLLTTVNRVVGTPTESNRDVWVDTFTDTRRGIFEDDDTWREAVSRLEVLDAISRHGLCGSLDYIINNTPIHLDTGVACDTATATITIDTTPVNASPEAHTYPEHTVIAQVVSIGQEGSTAFDEDPNTGEPHNSFNVALPFEEFTEDGLVPGAREQMYWADEIINLADDESLIKGRVVEIRANGKTAYAQVLEQIEPADMPYAVGTAPPKRKDLALFISPDVAEYLGIHTAGEVTWSFYDGEMPAGPWSEVVSTNKTDY